MEAVEPIIEVSCVNDLYENTEVSAETLIVAFASMDGECVDQHFGSARGFFVYEIDGGSAKSITHKLFPKELKDGNEDKLKPKLAWLLGCDLVYCGSIGGSATKQLVTIGVHPVVVKEGPDVEEVIAELQEELNSDLSPMLQRIFQKKMPKTDNRFEEMDDEDWDE